MALLEGRLLLKGDYIVVFYYLCASKIWPNKRGGLLSEWFYKRGTVVLWFPPPNSDGINEILMKVALILMNLMLMQICDKNDIFYMIRSFIS